MELRILRQYSLSQILIKIVGRLRRLLISLYKKLLDYIFGSYKEEEAVITPLAPAIKVSDIPEDLRHYLSSVDDAYLEHRFNLLGSGWTKVFHGAECNGFENHRFQPKVRVVADGQGNWLRSRINRSNLPESTRIWRLIDSENYQPIDWQLDFKSGFRWSERCYHTGIITGPKLGADIKVPWELSRCQHLPQLALCALLSGEGDKRFLAAEFYLDEIRAQLLDFISTNPPRFGVNWSCTMDVAIRLSNWLLTLDLLAVNDLYLDDDSMTVISRSVTSHATYIAGHLEWSEFRRSNHYLADLVGLIYASRRLPHSRRTDAWLVFAAKELMNEASVQFHTEGSSYEGSTNYHRLSAELLLFGVALIAGLSGERLAQLENYSASSISIRPPFPSDPLRKYSDVNGLKTLVPTEITKMLWKVARFTDSITRPDGRILQIGDTDSGRLFCLHPVSINNDPPERDDLDHRALVESVDALFDLKKKYHWFDSAMVRGMVGDWRPIFSPKRATLNDHGNPEEIKKYLESFQATQLRVRHYPLGETGIPWKRVAYPKFGLYLFWREEDFVAFRCFDSIPFYVPDGHFHDDNLGLEIMLAGNLIVSDPGTYVYTADPQIRNEYRQSSAHDCPRAKGWEVSRITKSLFTLRQDAHAERTCWREDAVAGKIPHANGTIYRLISFGKTELEIWDGVSDGSLRSIPDQPSYCQGYGKQT